MLQMHSYMVYLVNTFDVDQMEMESLKESHPKSDKILKL